MSDVLAIIPARTNSRGIPNKNFAKLAGHSPVFRAIQCCDDAGIPFVLTTDGLVRMSTRPLQPSEYLIRDKALAQDDTPMIDVVRHALANTLGGPDQIVLLVQPTQPLRTPKHLRDAVKWMQAGARSVVSVTDTEPYERTMVLDDEGNLKTFVRHPLDFKERRQEADPLYRRDGTVYAFRRADATCPSAHYSAMPWYTSPCRPLFIPKDETTELDTPEDWRIAEARLMSRHAAMAR
jgi:CMP-N-acetylneuraminic acid synthetase